MPSKSTNSFVRSRSAIKIEIETTTTAVRKSKLGVMMNETRAIKYWMSVEGGEYAYPDAKAQWDVLSKNRTHPRDNDGPPEV